MKNFILAIALSTISSCALAQSNPGITPEGAITPGHAMKFGSTKFRAQDGGVNLIPGGVNGNVQFNNSGALGGLTDTQLTARINAATAALSGALPAFPGNTSTFFRGDGTYSNTITAMNISATGSAVSPSFNFPVCSADCGFYAPAANQFAFAQAGAIKLDWNIGTAGRWTFYADLAANGNRYTGATSFSFTTGMSITSPGANALQLFAADNAAPPVSNLFIQSVLAGTSNVAGSLFTLRGSLSTGSGVSGDIIFQTGGTGAGATVQNTALAALTLKGATQNAIFTGPVIQFSNAAYVSCQAIKTDASGNLSCTTVAGLSAPTYQKFLTGSGTYTTPANVRQIRGRMVGAGSGGASGNGTGSSAAGNTCWNTTGAACTTPVFQSGGAAATPAASTSAQGGVGGTIAGSGTCDIAIAGGDGDSAGIAFTAAAAAKGGHGGNSFLGGAGSGGLNSSAGTAAKANSGAGGGGGGESTAATAGAGGGGGAGAYCEFHIDTPAATYTYAVGAKSTGSTGPGLGGANGADGADGGIWIQEIY